MESTYQRKAYGPGLFLGIQNLFAPHPQLLVFVESLDQCQAMKRPSYVPP